MTDLPIVTARRVDLDAKALIGTPATDAEPTVSAPALVVDADTGAPVVLVERFDGDLARFRHAAMAYPMNSVVRAAGIRNRSNVFGFTARHVVMQRNVCRSCLGASAAPDAHLGITAVAPVLASQLRARLPDLAEHDEQAAKVINADWRIAGTQWTSGVLNETSPLPYHFDRNNLDTWSSMLVVRRGVRGGHLSIPAYGLVLECRDGDVVSFAGWGHVHAVTPLHKTQRDGYRFSAVFYTVAKMRQCLPVEEEMAQGRATRSAREDDLRSGDERLGKR